VHACPVEEFACDGHESCPHTKVEQQYVGAEGRVPGGGSLSNDTVPFQQILYKAGDPASGKHHRAGYRSVRGPLTPTGDGISCPAGIVISIASSPLEKYK